MSPVPRHVDLPGFHYVKGVHWMVLAGAVADRLSTDKMGRVHVTRDGWRPRNVTLAAKSLLGRGLIEPWGPEETIQPTTQGRAYLTRKFPGGHPEFLTVMIDKALADAIAAVDNVDVEAIAAPPQSEHHHQSEHGHQLEMSQ